MSLTLSPDPRVEAVKELESAAGKLLQVALAYREVWKLQRQATDHLDWAGKWLQEWEAGHHVPREVKGHASSLGAAAEGAELLHLDVDEENVLEAAARAVEDVAGAARRLATALENVDRLFPEGGDA